jgi:hypothetical protein
MTNIKKGPNTMSKTTISRNLKRPAAFFSVTAALAVLLGSAPAFATGPTSPITGGVNLVEFSPGTLIVQSAGVNYYAQLNAATNCTTNNQTADTLKAWLSEAQAALLSGKSVQIYFNDCGPTGAPVHYISALDIKQ